MASLNFLPASKDSMPVGRPDTVLELLDEEEREPLESSGVPNAFE